MSKIDWKEEYDILDDINIKLNKKIEELENQNVNLAKAVVELQDMYSSLRYASEEEIKKLQEELDLVSKSFYDLNKYCVKLEKENKKESDDK